MTTDTDIRAKTRQAGQVLFILGFLGLTILALALMPWETRWFDGTKLAAQPRLWSAVGLVTMAICTALHLLRMRHRRPRAVDWTEARLWLRPFEYALWFMVYVWAVPIIGFLPASLIFAPLLTWRVGYRTKPMLWSAAAFGLATVVVFKSMLSVKIPGGLIYEYLPGTLRSFAILNL